MKAYKIPDFKTAEEWCGDSEHSGEPYCEKYFNDKAAKLECTDEAKKRITTANGGDALILYAARPKVGGKCEVITCQKGYSPNKEKNRCWNSDCTNEAKKLDQDVVYAQRDNEDGICRIKSCTGTKIPTNDGSRCTDGTAIGTVLSAQIESSSTDSNISTDLSDTNSRVYYTVKACYKKGSNSDCSMEIRDGQNSWDGTYCLSVCGDQGISNDYFNKYITKPVFGDTLACAKRGQGYEFVDFNDQNKTLTMNEEQLNKFKELVYKYLSDQNRNGEQKCDGHYHDVYFNIYEHDAPNTIGKKIETITIDD